MNPLEARPSEPTLEELHEKLRLVAQNELEGKRSGGETLPSVIADASARGFVETHHIDFSKEGPAYYNVRAILLSAAREAKDAFSGIKTKEEEALLTEEEATRNASRYKTAYSGAPKDLNRKYMTSLAQLVYPEVQDIDLDRLLTKNVNFNAIVEVTARQLGGTSLDTDVQHIVDVLEEVVPKDEGDYSRQTLTNLKEFMLADSERKPVEQDVLLTDLVLRLPNATWAGGQAERARYEGKPDRIQKDAFDVPDRRTAVMFAKLKEQHGEEGAFALVVLENAKDYLNIR